MSTDRGRSSRPGHTWFRKYEGFAGRWTTPDPYPGTIGNPQTLNRYPYVNNDPINSVDPTGLRDDICGYDESGPIYCGNDEPPIRTFTNERGPSLSEYLWILNSSFGGFTGGGGGGGGGTPGNPVEPEDDADDDKDKKCDELSNRIQELRDELAKRAPELVETTITSCYWQKIHRGS